MESIVNVFCTCVQPSNHLLLLNLIQWPEGIIVCSSMVFIESHLQANLLFSFSPHYQSLDPSVVLIERELLDKFIISRPILAS